MGINVFGDLAGLLMHLKKRKNGRRCDYGVCHK